MDPQQRLLLEHSYDAFHDAGLQRQALLGSSNGVFVGITYTEFAQVVQPGVYALTGCGHCFAAGRLSYNFGLLGPCSAIDTACSAGLVACHSAGRAIIFGECPAAVIAGVNVMLVPTTNLMLAVGGMTSATGRSYTFDKRADGFARGEGCGAGLVQAATGSSLEIIGSAVRQDGKSASLTAPSGPGQQGLIRTALADATVDADQ
eukprot:6817057-Prymnesium_polylepis.1